MAAKVRKQLQAASPQLLYDLTVFNAAWEPVAHLSKCSLTVEELLCQLGMFMTARQRVDASSVPLIDAWAEAEVFSVEVVRG
jgi:hypothetical protein